MFLSFGQHHSDPVIVDSMSMETLPKETAYSILFNVANLLEFTPIRNP